MKKWKCTVCGYIHEGDEPPENCPVCGVGSEYFEEIEGQEEEKGVQDTAAPEREPVAEKAELTGLSAQVMKHHLHPITVHTPNGVLPVGLVFLALATLFGLTGFELAAFYNLVFVLLVMPAVIATGVIVWRYRYKGAKTKVFITKIAASFIVTVSLVGLVVWRIIDPTVTTTSGKWIYLLICLVMVGAAGLAGHLGGKLVFDTRK